MVFSFDDMLPRLLVLLVVREGHAASPVFATRTDLYYAVSACLTETPDGSCPLYISDAWDDTPIGLWNVAKVTDMRYIFYAADAFNQDLTA